MLNTLFRYLLLILVLFSHENWAALEGDSSGAPLRRRRLSVCEAPVETDRSSIQTDEWPRGLSFQRDQRPSILRKRRPSVSVAPEACEIAKTCEIENASLSVKVSEDLAQPKRRKIAISELPRGQDPTIMNSRTAAWLQNIKNEMDTLSSLVLKTERKIREIEDNNHDLSEKKDSQDLRKAVLLINLHRKTNCELSRLQENPLRQMLE